MQCLGGMNTVAIDKTDGCTVYFPRSVIETLELRTSKCSDPERLLPQQGRRAGVAREAHSRAVLSSHRR